MTPEALLTGMRRGELLALRWEHVNLGRVLRTFVIGGETWEAPPGWLLIGRSKNGRPRALPLSGKAQGMLRQLFEDETRGAYVFQNGRTGVNISDIKTGFTGSCRDAGINNLTFHDLRHTCASRAGSPSTPQASAPTRIAAELVVGHGEAETNEKYVKIRKAGPRGRPPVRRKLLKRKGSGGET